MNIQVHIYLCMYRYIYIYIYIHISHVCSCKKKQKLACSWWRDFSFLFRSSVRGFQGCEPTPTRKVISRVEPWIAPAHTEKHIPIASQTNRVERGQPRCSKLLEIRWRKERRVGEQAQNLHFHVQCPGWRWMYEAFQGTLFFSFNAAWVPLRWP